MRLFCIFSSNLSIMSIRKFLAICVLVVLSNSLQAQDAHFSQIQYNPVYLNPAFAGFAGKDNRLVGLYRDQWRTIPIPYSTTYASYDRKVKYWADKGWRLGAGVSFLYDRAGDGHLSTFNPNLTMSAGKYFNSDKQLISLGITAGITVKSIDYSKLSFDNQYNGTGYDPTLPTGETFSNNNVSFANFTIGLNFRTKIKEKSSLDVGGSASNMHQPNQNFLYFSEDKLAARYEAYAKALVAVGKSGKWNLQPGVYYQRQRKNNNSLINSIAEYRFDNNSKGKSFGIGFGAGYRVKDAAITYVSFLYDNLRVGAAYDINTSGLRKATNTVGAFEIALNYEFGESKDKKKKTDTITIHVIDTITDTVYIEKTDTVTIEKPVVEKIPCDTNNLGGLLPVAIYFNNDYPDPRSKKAATSQSYHELYSDYIAKKAEFAKYMSAADADKLFATVEETNIRLENALNEIEKVLQTGHSVSLVFKGYASPLAKEDYNKILSKRRINSVLNYLVARNNGVLKKYMDNGSLTFEEVPFGESEAAASVSDKLSDKKNSVYSLNASLERRVEVLYVIIK